MHINLYIGSDITSSCRHLALERQAEPAKLKGRTLLCFGHQQSVHLGDRLDQPNCRVWRQAAPATQHVALERPAAPALASAHV